MKKALPVLFFALIFPSIFFAQTIIGEFTGDLTTLNSNKLGNSVALSADGTIISYGVPGANPGQVKVFRKDNNTWTQIGDELNVNGETGDFGDQVALSSDGNIIAISAPHNQEKTGLVQVFQNIDDSWIQIGENIDGQEPADAFGGSIDLSADGTTLAIGTIGNYSVDSLSTIGYVKVFQNINDSWIQIGETLQGTEVRSYFGRCVSLSADGSILAVGVPGILSTTIGYVKVYQNINNTWIPFGDEIHGEALKDRFGYSIDIPFDDNNLIVIGAPGSTSQGAETIGYVKIFSYDNNTWNSIGTTLYGDKPRDLFGNAISISSDGNIVAIGVPRFKIDPTNFIPDGQVKIFTRNGNDWNQTSKEIFVDTIRGQHFGHSLYLASDGKTIAIGDYAYSGGAGKVYIYEDLVMPTSTLQIKENNLTIFPNPTSGLIHFDGVELDQVRLINSIGSILISKQNPISFIDISSLPAGLYFLNISVGGVQFTRQIAKK